ncbi:MAG: HD domain-containing protein, partial [Nitrospirae bacterium]|nr:HD domain-containing protein [Nitrospirota bacterium]
MIFTPKTQQAIRFAIEAHAEQTRKGNDIPYITHPLTIALILSQAGASEDVIVAGILHDVVEDSDVELDDVLNEFG